MLFSVIVPVYKVEEYLSECVESILAQDFTDFELILVDDGSPDQCPLLCDNFAKKNHRVIVVHKENGGLSSARNEGLRHASGEYIVYLDSDDYFLDTHSLSKIAEKTIKYPDLIIYKTAMCRTNGVITYPNMSFSFNSEKCSVDEMVAITVKGEEFQTSAWSKAVRREFLVSNKIEFTEKLLGEDIDWYLAVIKKAGSYAIVDDYLYVYRSREGSITKTTGLKNLTDLIWILNKWTEILIRDERDAAYRDKALCHYLGKTYTSLLINYAEIKDSGKKEYKQCVKKLSYLLTYDNYPRTRVIHRFYSVFGFDGTIAALSLLIRIRK